MRNYKYRIVKISDNIVFDGRDYYRIEHKPLGLFKFIIPWSYYDTFVDLQEAIAKCKSAINRDKEKQKPITQKIVGVYLP